MAGAYQRLLQRTAGSIHSNNRTNWQILQLVMPASPLVTKRTIAEMSCEQDAQDDEPPAASEWGERTYAHGCRAEYRAPDHDGLAPPLRCSAGPGTKTLFT